MAQAGQSDFALDHVYWPLVFVAVAGVLWISHVMQRWGKSTGFDSGSVLARIYHNSDTSKKKTNFSFLSRGVDCVHMCLKMVFRSVSYLRSAWFNFPDASTVSAGETSREINWIKCPSYFYASIYNVTSYCFAMVCLWTQRTRDIWRKSSVMRLFDLRELFSELGQRYALYFSRSNY